MAENPQRENPHGGPHSEYGRLAASYDQRWSGYISATTRETLGDLKLENEERVLDLGCGTGALLAGLQHRAAGLQLTGVDPVSEMLQQASRKSLNDAWLVQANAEALPFADNAFDQVVSASACHYMHRPDQVAGELRRVLCAGGQLTLTDWCADYLSMRLLDRYLRWRDTAHVRTWRMDELVELLQQHGFCVQLTRRFRIGLWWGMMRISAVSS